MPRGGVRWGGVRGESHRGRFSPHPAPLSERRTLYPAQVSATGKGLSGDLFGWLFFAGRKPRVRVGEIGQRQRPESEFLVGSASG